MLKKSIPLNWIFRWQLFPISFSPFRFNPRRQYGKIRPEQVSLTQQGLTPGARSLWNIPEPSQTLVSSASWRFAGTALLHCTNSKLQLTVLERARENPLVSMDIACLLMTQQLREHLLRFPAYFRSWINTEPIFTTFLPVLYFCSFWNLHNSVSEFFPT